MQYTDSSTNKEINKVTHLQSLVYYTQEDLKHLYIKRQLCQETPIIHKLIVKSDSKTYSSSTIRQNPPKLWNIYKFYIIKKSK